MNSHLTKGRGGSFLVNMDARSNVWRFVAFLRPYRWRLLIALILTLFAQGLGFPVPLIMGHLVDHLPILAKSGLSEGMPFLIQWTLVLLGILVASPVVGFFNQYLLIIIGQRLLFDLRHMLYRHIQKLSLRFYETRQTGRILSRVLYDVETLQGLATSGVIELVADIVGVIIALGLIFWINWRLALISIGILPLHMLNFWLMRGKIRWAALDMRDKWSEISGNVHEKVAGVRVVKSFTTERLEVRKFTQDMREFFDFSLRRGVLGNLLSNTAGVINGLGIVAIWALGGWQVLAGVMTVGMIVAYMGYHNRLVGPILGLTRVSQMVQTAMASIDRIFETLDTLPDVKETEDTPPRKIKGQVEFRNVFFGYESDLLVLKNISFVAEPGTVTALVGPSGGGKTTVVNLIPRFYDPLSGSVRIDGVSVKDMKLTSLRNQIGIVLQETYLFSGTIRDNIKYGRADATDEEVIEAAKAANAHEFILEQKYGYDTEIGERGARLSGGQKQRIAIARAILRNPRILILDEATSSLDSEAEAQIQAALKKLMRGRTTFVIAHRLSTVMNADRILVIEDGEITERGTHEELVQAGGKYSELCQIQFRLDKDLLTTAAPPSDN